MGRLIDADKIMDKMESTFDMQELYLPIHFKELIIDDMPSIEAIPKADYENRLKADMVAMLEVIKLRIDNLSEPLNRDRVIYCVQEIINELKAESEGT